MPPKEKEISRYLKRKLENKEADFDLQLHMKEQIELSSINVRDVAGNEVQPQQQLSSSFESRPPEVFDLTYETCGNTGDTDIDIEASNADELFGNNTYEEDDMDDYIFMEGLKDCDRANYLALVCLAYKLKHRLSNAAFKDHLRILKLFTGSTVEEMTSAAKCAEKYKNLIQPTKKLMFQLLVNVFVVDNGVGVAFLKVMLEIGVRFQMKESLLLLDTTLANLPSNSRQSAAVNAANSAAPSRSMVKLHEDYTTMIDPSALRLAMSYGKSGNTTKEMGKMVATIMEALWDKAFMASHSLSGRKQPSDMNDPIKKKLPAKPAIPADARNAIIQFTMKFWKTKHNMRIPATTVNPLISQKLLTEHSSVKKALNNDESVDEAE
ncbi:hypothetical protein OUZ56_012284 [Daphnia magna]|uniref:Uncharacterized protein n=1 Tax=Daphnia magna TaxID=35525 RepID=A0ABQ9Z2J7_9CRUS|nr:hypothetical protein OUZ56_012284 [Daphnia magna]